MLQKKCYYDVIEYCIQHDPFYYYNEGYKMGHHVSIYVANMHACIHSLHYLGRLEGGPTKMNHHDPFFKLTTKLNKINYLFCCDCAHTYIYILSFIIQSNTKITCNDAYKQILNKIIHNGKNIKFNKSSERKKLKKQI